MGKNISANITGIFSAYRPEHLISESVAGCIAGLLSVIYAISFAALIFTGPLTGYLPIGIGIALFSAFVLAVVITVTSHYQIAVGITQDKPAAIMALAVAAVAAGVSRQGTPDQLIPSVLAIIGLTTVSSGLFFFLWGHFRMGRFIRYIPYPVVGGFVAGTGWLIIQGSFSVLTGAPLSLDQVPRLLDAAMILRWLPSLLFAILLVVMLRRVTHFLAMPGLILAAIALFYILMQSVGITHSQAEAAGWLLGPFPSGRLWKPFDVNSLALVHWSLVFEQVGSVVAVMLVSAISILFNATALELTTNHDIDLDRELRSTGIANIFSGLGGGLTGYHSLSLCTLNHKMGSRSRFSGALAALICGVVLCFGASLFSFFPKPVMGGLLFFLGASFLTEWAYDAWFRLPRTDYFLVIVILFCIAGIGFLPGVGIGLVVAIVLFVVKYSSINVVKNELSGAFHRSNVERPPHQVKVLDEEGDQLYILRLQGFLFFGTANRILNQVIHRLRDSSLPPLRFALLDFHMVTGLDSSAALSFTKLYNLTRSESITLVFTHLTEEAEHQFHQESFMDMDDTYFSCFSDLDYGVEWCEDQLLEREDTEREGRLTLHEQLKGHFIEDASTKRFMDFLKRMEIREGAFIFRQGDQSDGLYFIEAGELSVLVVSEDGSSIRLRTMGAGTVVGEMALYTLATRSASIQATKPSVLHHLSTNAFRELGQKEPELASVFHQFIIQLLAERLDHANKEIQVLLR